MIYFKQTQKALWNENEKKKAGAKRGKEFQRLNSGAKKRENENFNIVNAME